MNYLQVLAAFFPLALASTAMAADSVSSAADNRARLAMQEVLPAEQVHEIRAAPVDGFREVLANGRVFYVSDDGRYIFQGSLYDVRERENLSEGRLNSARRMAIEFVPKEQRIIFSPDNPKYTVAVFTDYECGYCRKMHSQIAEYNKLGIAIEYLAWPRAGLQGLDYKVMESIWCAGDKKAALTDAKSGNPISVKGCESPVAAHYRLGQKLGVRGTPAVFSASGEYLGGYKSPHDLMVALEKGN